MYARFHESGRGEQAGRWFARVCVGRGGALDSAMQQRARGACGRKRWKKTHLSSVP